MGWVALVWVGCRARLAGLLNISTGGGLYRGCIILGVYAIILPWVGHPKRPEERTMQQTRKTIEQAIKSNWKAIQAKAGTHPVDLPGSLTLLGSSAKLEKGKGVAGSDKYAPAILYLQPAHSAFTNGTTTLCKWAGTCKAVCLASFTGRMIFAGNNRARQWKTALYIGAPQLFHALLCLDIEKHARRATAAGLIPAVRFDGGSDTGRGLALARLYPAVAFYDYTKSTGRCLSVAKRQAAGQLSNYTLAYSYNETTTPWALEKLTAAGCLIAAVTPRNIKKGEPCPDSISLAPLPVIDGDKHDILPVHAAAKGKGAAWLALGFKQARDRPAALVAGLKSGFIVE